MRYVILLLTIIILGSSAPKESTINWYGKNDSINYVIGYGKIYFMDGDTMTTKFYNDVYKDLILVKKEDKKIDTYTPMDINYIVVDSHYDTANFIYAPFEINGLDKGFYRVWITGDIGFLTKSIIVDHADTNGFLVYYVHHTYYVLIGDKAYNIRDYFKIRKDVIPLLPKYQNELMEIYNEMEFSKFDKKDQQYNDEKCNAIKYLFEEYNKLENPEYVNQVQYIEENGL